MPEGFSFVEFMIIEVYAIASKNGETEMEKKVIKSGLLFCCMLFIGTATYSIPVGCAKLDIRGKQVYILSDQHNDIRVSPRQTSEIDRVLSNWVEQLFREEGKTLFILERNDQPHIMENDTIESLCGMARRYPDVSKVEFKRADRRTEIIRIFYEFHRGLSENVKFSFAELGDKTPINTLQGAESLIDTNQQRNAHFRELYFSRIFRDKLRPIFVSVVYDNPHKRDLFLRTTSAQFLEAFANVKREVMDNLSHCDSTERSELASYLQNLNEIEASLTRFISSEDPIIPFYAALFNVIEKSKSFRRYNDLCHMTMYTFVKFIADYGFYIDMTNAIRDPMVKRIVLCAGGVHTENLVRLLRGTYPELKVIIEVGHGISRPVTRDTIESLSILAPEELCRILGLHSVPVLPPSPLPLQPQQAPVLHQCAKCGRQEGVPNQFSRCSRCKQVFYCSQDCQRAHWRVHKNTCR